MDRNMYLLKEAQAELFERQFILARDSLIEIHSELLGGNIYDEVELRKLLDRIEVHLEAIGVTHKQGSELARSAPETTESA